LQGASAIPESSDLISERQLLDIGNEVGLSPAMLNQALAEERTRVNVPEERGLVAQIAGAGFATATRTVPGTPRDVLAPIGGAMAAAASGVLGLGLIVAHLPLLIAAGGAMLPFAGGTFAAYKVARTHRGVLSSVQLALEQILDRLEHGEFDRSGGLLGVIASRARLPGR